jgi:transcriptional regulator with XRE-family HTH domain
VTGQTSPGSEPREQRAQLGAELRRLRDRQGLSGREVAQHLGIGQASVSRIEAGLARTTLPQVEAWADITRATAAQRQTLLTLAEAALTEIENWRARGHDGLAEMQNERRDLAAVTGLYLCYQPTIVPGLLQIPEYARRVFSIVDVEGGEDYSAAVAQRIERQHVLYQGSHRFDFVLTETALRARIVPDKLLQLQHAHLRSMASLDNVNISVIPLTADLQDKDLKALGWCGFNVYDDRGDFEPFVSIELPLQGITLNDPEQVQFYREQFQQLKALAVELTTFLDV